MDRRFGWDTHGLPAELEVQRQLGITDKAQIEEMGIGKFNDACRDSVLKYTDEWRAYVTRQARWVDFDNDYKTLDPTFMESVIWAFKQLWDKGLAYEGYRVLPYCWNDETPLSSHELRMDDDVYQSRQDPAITVGFRIAERSAGRRPPAGLDDDPVDAAVQPGGRRQPRRRPTSQVAGPDERRYVLARGRGWPPTPASSATNRECSATYPGADLLGMRYLPPFPYFMDSPNAFQVLPRRLRHHRGRHRHRAHGAGLRRGRHGDRRQVGIEPVTPVDSKGRFDAPVPDYQGQHVFDANPQIIRDLKNRSGPARGQRRGAVAPRDLRALLPALLALPKPVDLPGGVVVVRQGHRVPRPDGGTQPADHLVSRTRQRRPVRQVAAGRPRLVDLAEPLLGHARFRCGSPTTRRIRGSTSTAASTNSSATSGCGPTDLHRPYIDELTRPNPDDPTGAVDHAAHRGRLRRVVRLGIDAVRPGALPVRERRMVRRCRPPTPAQVDAHFPGDFIVEYIGQTRGWFYTLHVLATALFDKPAFKTCVAHGIVLGNDGQKMSKSLRNYPDVSEVFDRDGSDAMRWFLMASPILRGGNLVVTEQGIRDGVRQVLLPLWNAYTFLTLYAPQSRYLAHGFGECAGPLHPGQARRNCATTSPARWTSATSPVPASSCASSPRR